MESWGEVKSLPSQWEGERNWWGGRGRGKKNPPFPPRPPPPPTFSHRILAPILPVLNESKMAAKHSKGENHQNPHQNRLHCRLRPGGSRWHRRGQGVESRSSVRNCNAYSYLFWHKVSLWRFKSEWKTNSSWKMSLNGTICGEISLDILNFCRRQISAAAINKIHLADVFTFLLPPNTDHVVIHLGEYNWVICHTPGGVLPYMGFTGNCGPSGYNFLAVFLAVFASRKKRQAKLTGAKKFILQKIVQHWPSPQKDGPYLKLLETAHSHVKDNNNNTGEFAVFCFSGMSGWLAK